MSLLPKAGMCCQESSRSLGELSLFCLLRPLPTNLLYQLREEVRVGIALIQKKIILCSVTLSFSGGINLFCAPWIAWDLEMLLRAAFLQLRSLHSHFSSCSPVLWQPQPDPAMPLRMQRCGSWPLERKLQPCVPHLLRAAGRALLPLPPSHGAGAAGQPLTPAVRIRVGWGSANYPVLTRVRPARTLAVHTDVFPASCAG